MYSFEEKSFYKLLFKPGVLIECDLIRFLLFRGELESETNAT